MLTCEQRISASSEEVVTRRKIELVAGENPEKGLRLNFCSTWILDHFLGLCNMLCSLI